MNARIKTAATQRVLLVLAIVAAAGLGSCGTPMYCASSFDTFLDDEWRAYCNEFDHHVQYPGEYTLADLTKFFGKHPKKVSRLKKKLNEFDNPDACFPTAREQVELKTLRRCIDHNEQQQYQVEQAWNASGGEWVKDLEIRTNETKPKLKGAKLFREKAYAKVKQAYQFNAPVKGDLAGDYAAMLDEINGRIEISESGVGLYRELLRGAKGNKPLSSTMKDEIGPIVERVAGQAEDQKKALRELKMDIEKLALASNGAGRECPTGVKGKSATMKAAKSALADKMRAKGAKELQLTSGVKRTKNDEGATVERFSGHICGVRGKDNQIKGMPQLCGAYDFVVEREKPDGARKYGSWNLAAFQESGPGGSFDCRNIKTTRKGGKRKDPTAVSSEALEITR